MSFRTSDKTSWCLFEMRHVVSARTLFCLILEKKLGTRQASSLFASCLNFNALFLPPKVDLHRVDIQNRLFQPSVAVNFSSPWVKWLQRMKSRSTIFWKTIGKETIFRRIEILLCGIHGLELWGHYGSLHYYVLFNYLSIY